MQGLCVCLDSCMQQGELAMIHALLLRGLPELAKLTSWLLLHAFLPASA